MDQENDTKRGVIHRGWMGASSGRDGRANQCQYQCRWVLFALLAVGAMVLGACEGAPRATGIEDSGVVVPRGAAPTYESVAAGYNARVAATDRLTSPVSVLIDSDKEGGGRTRDQLEGNLSIVRPYNVALRLDKVGQTVAYLGSNDFAYWWFDLSKEPVAISGTRLKARPDDAADFGLPVHPLEFVELLGVLAIPGQPPKDGRVAWSKNGRYVQVTVPSRWGYRKFTLDPVTFEPVSIDLLDSEGQLAVRSLLSRFALAPIEGKAGTSAPVPQRVEILIPGSSTTVIMVLADARVPLKIKPRAFEMSQLVSAYGIKKFVDHDDPHAVKARRDAAGKATPARPQPKTAGVLK